jgi:hypothetical protein
MPRLPSNTTATSASVAAAVLACAEPSSPTLELAPSRESAVDAPTVEPQQSGTTQRLQAVSPVNEDVVWASGVGGTFAVTTNGGRRWLAHLQDGGRGRELGAPVHRGQSRGFL